MKTTIYEPNSQLKCGLRIWPQMFKELINCRELIWRLFLRDWSAKYKQSILGYLWAIIMPVIAIGTFIILNREGILEIGDTEIPYPLFALIGLSIWQIFSTGITAGCQSLTSSSNLISKINFPIESLVIAAVGQSVFDFLIKIVLIAGVLAIYGLTPPITIVFFPILAVPMLILTFGIALILSILNGLSRDIANIVPLATTFLMFLTPVLYPISEDKSFLLQLNPLSPLINAPRDLFIYGYIRDPMSFFVSTSISVLIFLICWRIFFLLKTKIPERV